MGFKKQLNSSIYVWKIVEPPIFTLKPDESLTYAIRKLGDNRLLEVPVINKMNKLLGTISIWQIADRVSHGLSLNAKVGDIMENKNLSIVKKNDVLDLNSFSEAKITYVCEEGILTGAIYIENILKAYQWKTQALERFEKLSNEYELILNNCYDSIYSTDDKGKVLWVNRSSENITGKKPAQVIGKNVSELETEHAFFPSATNLVLQHKKRRTIVQNVKDRHKVVVTSVPVFNENGDMTRVITVTRDVAKLIEDIEKFTKSTEFEDLFNRLIEANRLTERYCSELRRLRKQQFAEKKIIACSREMKIILELIKNIASVDTTVLILGESGVGKDVVAKTIHEISDRKEGPFMKINCGAIPQTLLESELFGYEPGAFTGASKKRKLGLIEMASEGTLFLDEIADLPLNLQVKLLQVIQEKKFIRIGGVEPITVDIRIIAATNKDINAMVKEGKFREDLFYRLNVVPITIPPLRKRKGDIPQLIFHFTDVFNKKYNRNKQLASETIDILLEYRWLGNVRELENLIERLVVITKHDIIQPYDLPQNITPSKKYDIFNYIDADETVSLKDAIETVESKIIEKTYNKYKSTIKAAKILGVNQSTIVRKLKKYKINPNPK